MGKERPGQLAEGKTVGGKVRPNQTDLVRFSPNTGLHNSGSPTSPPPLPILPHHPRPLLRNRIHRRLDMRAHLQRHHACIAHPQPPGPIHPQPRIHDPVLDPGAPAHRAGAHGVPVRDRVGADEGGEIFVVFGCLVGGGGGGGAGRGSGVDG